ncbi:hypothetical protein CANINC_003542 [Pichia inconspicua]|uniref:FAD-binding FR-type domain-containing protein n=1 Tax=Pichia inconspicua TaxID=52247 RepID=A0A4T0WYG6_9ASCO|nr:hypothetical protein CANINC_003542 [[Candida] inconspicua]
MLPLLKRVPYKTKFTLVPFRFKSSLPPDEPTDPPSGENSLPLRRSEDFNELTEKFNPDLSSKVTKPSASLPAMDPSLQSLMTKAKVQYNPTLNTQQESYEFKAPKSPKQLYKEELQQRATPKSKLRKLLPSLLICGGICWAIFTYKYMTRDTEKNVDKDSALLRDDKFLTYLVSFKHKIDDDHYLIELTRKNRAEKLIHNEQLFNGERLWSIEIAQPEINIVRNYTPLPMYVAGIDPNTQEPHLRLVKELEEEGKFIIIVKRYNDGEFSRWLTSRNLLDEIKIRGPIIEYKIPFHPLDRYEERPQMSNTITTIKPDPKWPENLPKPENFAYFGAGTGILPLFQLIYSPNPPKGFIDVWYSLRHESELLPQIKTLNFFAEKIGRVKFHYLISDEGDHRRLTLNDIPTPTLPNFTGGLDMRISEEVYRQKLLREKKQEVQRQLKSNDVSVKEIDNKLIVVDAKTGNLLDNSEVIKPHDARVQPENAYQQWTFFKKKNNSDVPSPSFAFVCGPEEYIAAVSGKPDLNNLEKIDNGPIGGMLKEKGWSQNNVKRLQ